MAETTSSEITIGAPAAAVMTVIADFDAYPQWATGVRSARITEAGPGGRARRVRFDLDAGIIKDSYELVYQWDALTSVQWELAGPASTISQMSGGYRLTPDGKGTRVIYDLAVGLRVPMIGMLKRRAEKTIIDTALAGLRARVESGRAGGGGDRG